jgi:hypothetical protein
MNPQLALRVARIAAAARPHEEEGPDGEAVAVDGIGRSDGAVRCGEDGMVFGIGSAQARVGRPLTPMSYAGVARRTTRRAYRRGYYYGGYHY